MSTRTADPNEATADSLPDGIDYLGIDLAAQPGNTAVCAIYDRGGKLVAQSLRRPDENWTDKELLRVMGRARWIGIDAPFGWPIEFAAAVAGSADGGFWEPSARHPKRPNYDYSQLRLRSTDRFVARLTRPDDIRTCHPLSVSSDSIGVVAFRAASLLSAFRGTGWTFDRTGATNQAHRVIEVYPAATLALLKIRQKGAVSYKKKSSLELRGQYLHALCDQKGHEISLGSNEDALLATDHDFDAFVSAFTALLAAKDETWGPDTVVESIPGNNGST